MRWRTTTSYDLTGTQVHAIDWHLRWSWGFVWRIIECAFDAIRFILIPFAVACALVGASLEGLHVHISTLAATLIAAPLFLLLMFLLGYVFAQENEGLAAMRAEVRRVRGEGVEFEVVQEASWEAFLARLR